MYNYSYLNKPSPLLNYTTWPIDKPTTWLLRNDIVFGFPPSGYKPIL